MAQNPTLTALGKRELIGRFLGLGLEVLTNLAAPRSSTCLIDASWSPPDSTANFTPPVYNYSAQKFKLKTYLNRFRNLD